MTPSCSRLAEEKLAAAHAFLELGAKLGEPVRAPEEDVIARQIEVYLGAARSMRGVVGMVILAGHEDQIGKAADPQRVADLEVAVGALVGEIGDEDLGALEEPDDLTVEQAAAGVAVRTSRLEGAAPQGRDDGVVVDAVELLVPDLHDHEGEVGSPAGVRGVSQHVEEDSADRRIVVVMASTSGHARRCAGQLDLGELA